MPVDVLCFSDCNGAVNGAPFSLRRALRGAVTATDAASSYVSQDVLDHAGRDAMRSDLMSIAMQRDIMKAPFRPSPASFEVKDLQCHLLKPLVPPNTFFSLLSNGLMTVKATVKLPDYVLDVPGLPSSADKNKAAAAAAAAATANTTTTAANKAAVADAVVQQGQKKNSKKAEKKEGEVSDEAARAAAILRVGVQRMMVDRAPRERRFGYMAPSVGMTLHVKLRDLQVLPEGLQGDIEAQEPALPADADMQAKLLRQARIKGKQAAARGLLALLSRVKPDDSFEFDVDLQLSQREMMQWMSVQGDKLFGEHVMKLVTDEAVRKVCGHVGASAADYLSESSQAAVANVGSWVSSFMKK
jgi:hypothetical protein